MNIFSVFCMLYLNFKSNMYVSETKLNNNTVNTVTFHYTWSLNYHMR